MAEDVRIISQETPVVAATVNRGDNIGSKAALCVVLCNSSGDIYNASTGGGSGGDGAINDGADSNLKATVKDYAASNPLTVVTVNSSGDSYNANEPRRAFTGTFNVVNVGTSATQILAGNAGRISALVQNVDSQMVTIGFANTVTPGNGINLSPITTSSSGDGGSFQTNVYTGSLWGIVPSGDADVRYMEV